MANGEALDQFHRDVSSAVRLLFFSPILEDLDEIVQEQIRLRRHKNLSVCTDKAVAETASRIREINCEKVAELYRSGNTRRKLLKFYRTELLEERYQPICSVLTNYWDRHHRNTVLLIGVGGVMKKEAPMITGQLHVNCDRIASQIDDAMRQRNFYRGAQS